jgi:hypothetical protein
MGKGSRNSQKEVFSPPDVDSVDAILNALYESVTFPPGAQPDYDRLRSLFHPEGRITPPREEKDDRAPILDVEAFISKSRADVILTGLEHDGFFEKEVSRRTDAYGNIVHVLSTYESRHVEKDLAPFQRGINSIQLLHDSGRWWVVSILWDIERDDNPIPSHYEE